MKSPWLRCTALLVLLASGAASALDGVARQIVDAGPALSALWPGFWSSESAFLLYGRNGECLLVSTHPPQSGFAPHAERPDLWTGRCEGPRFGPPFLLGQRFGGIEAPAVRVGRGWAPAVADTLLHEAFHLYQARRFGRVPHARLRFEFDTSRDLVESKLHETALLIGALREDDQATRAARVSIASSLRRQRIERMGRTAAEVEDHFMRIEGSAEWLGVRARAAMDPTYVLASDLRARWRRFDELSGATWERLLRWQSYHAGAAAFELLDGLGVDWRAALEEGDAAWSLLDRHFETTAYDPESAWREARRLNRWAQVLRVTSSMIRAERRSARALAEFDGHRGERLEIRGPPLGFDVTFSARDIHSIGDSVLVRDASPLVVESEWIRLDARRRPVRILERGGRIVLLLARKLRIEGCEPGAEALCPAGTRFSGRGVTVELLEPSRVSVTERVLAIERDEPAQR